MSLNSRSAHWLLTCAICGVLVLGGCEWVSDSPDEQFERAVSHISSGQLKAGVIELKNVLRQDPDRVEARLLLGKVALQLGDGQSAEKEIRRAAELGAATSETQPQLVRALFLQKEFERVIEESERLVTGISETVRLGMQALRGRSQLRVRDPAAAEETLKGVIELDSSIVDALLGMAEWAIVAGDFQAAREWLDKAVEADSNSGEAWSLIGDIALRGGGREEAIDAYGRAIAAYRYVTVDIAKRALAYVHLDEFTKAEEDLERLRKAGFKEHPLIKYVEGYALFRQEKYAEAADALQAALTAEPGFVNAQIYLAITHLTLGNLELARSLSLRAQELAPHSRHAKRVLAATLSSNAEYEAAVRVLNEVLASKPDDVLALRMLASLALVANNPKEAVAYYRKLVELEPDSSEIKEKLLLASIVADEPLDDLVDTADPFAAFARAVEAFKSQDFTESLQTAQGLHARFPDDVDPLKLIAAVQIASGEWNEAKLALEKILALQPGDQSAARNLAIILVRDGDLARAESILADVVDRHPEDERALLMLASLQEKTSGRSSLDTLKSGLARYPDGAAIRRKLTEAEFAAGNMAEVVVLTQALDQATLEQQPVLLELRGKAQIRLGDFSAARDSFARLVSLAPRAAPAYFFYGDALARSGEPDFAAEQLKRAIALDPSYLPARVAEIKMLVHKGKIEEAKDALQALKHEFGPAAEVLGIEGWFALGIGDFKLATDRLSQVVEQRPDSESVQLLARSLWGQREYEQAFAVIDRWLANHPQDVGVLLHRAGGELALGRNEQARNTYKRVLEFYPEHVVSLNNYAWLGRDVAPKESLPYAELAADLAPGNAAVLNTLGTLRIKTGDIEGAIRLLRDAERAHPHDSEIRLTLGDGLVRAAQYAEAQEVLRPLIENPPNPDVEERARELRDRALSQ